MPDVNEQLRVLIVRLGAMGDILHALPAVTALRQAHPRWFLAWAVEPRWQPLLRDAEGRAPLVERIHLAKAKAWARAPFSSETYREIGALRRELMEERYDVCVDLQGAVRSALLARAAGAPRIVGEACPREPLARWLFRERIPTRGAHVIEQAAEVCSAIAGDRLQAAMPLLPADAEAEAWADALLSGETRAARNSREGKNSLGAQNSPESMRTAPLILLSPGAGWGAKRWPAERYGELAAMLCRAGCRVLVNAGPGEGEIATAVVEASGEGQGRPAAQAAELTLARLIAVIRRARLVVAGDTGPLHLACALGAPVVGIFGPTAPERNGPFGVPSRVLRHPASKRDHTRRAQPESGLLTITAAQVFAAAMELLEEGA